MVTPSWCVHITKTAFPDVHFWRSLQSSPELQLQLIGMAVTQPCTPEQKNTLTICQVLDAVIYPAVFWPQPVWELHRFAFPWHMEVSWWNAHGLPPASTPQGGGKKGPLLPGFHHLLLLLQACPMALDWQGTRAAVLGSCHCPRLPVKRKLMFQYWVKTLLPNIFIYRVSLLNWP